MWRGGIPTQEMLQGQRLLLFSFYTAWTRSVPVSTEVKLAIVNHTLPFRRPVPVRQPCRSCALRDPLSITHRSLYAVLKKLSPDASRIISRHREGEVAFMGLFGGILTQFLALTKSSFQPAFLFFAIST